MQAHTHPTPAPHATATGHLRIPRTKLRALFPAGLPTDAYGLILEGGCLEPMASDGDMVLASPSTSARVGDLVVVWPIEGRPSIKRLVVLPLPLPAHMAACAEVRPAVILATLTPSRAFAVSMSRVAALHGVVGLLRPYQYLRGVRSAGRAA